MKKLNGNFYIQYPSNVIVLKNLLTYEELVVDEEYRDIIKDMTLEGSKYGKVKSIQIPRPVSKFKASKGHGNIYI